MIDTIYFGILFVLACIVAIAPAMIFYIAFFNDEFDNFKNVADFFEFAAKLMRR